MVKATLDKMCVCFCSFADLGPHFLSFPVLPPPFLPSLSLWFHFPSVPPRLSRPGPCALHFIPVSRLTLHAGPVPAACAPGAERSASSARPPHVPTWSQPPSSRHQLPGTKAPLRLLFCSVCLLAMETPRNVSQAASAPSGDSPATPLPSVGE